ncbi:MAG: hypothetical protein ACOYI1_09015 [Caldicoprobacteraceae bacterium]
MRAIIGRYGELLMAKLRKHQHGINSSCCQTPVHLKLRQTHPI